ncbi:binding-protein-dependent transport system inner membrane protein [Natrialba hulunbeirensis JCM 10989]|uniref:Binding-protein-dependent transport system inner membrane protein n=1 Tax=Natrialba hulunbeirensis JCM 10989 TaxID=1227493 RepID=M0A0L4_9EURY|nr:ABC transporter permease [Natrialba hulunbeirensis]ELY92295.1 binding-protein-dependent transport system inner membrane protein [Natrialba hulunbeirensis JCM 10989]
MSGEENRVGDAELSANGRVLGTLAKLRHSPTSVAGLLIVGVLVAMAIFSAIDSFLFNRAIITWLHADPHAMDQSMRYSEPSRAHPFGTDRYGRDVFARIIYGSRTALTIGILAVGISFVGGVIIGAISAYFGGYVDDGLMRTVEVLYAIPGLVLAMIFMAIFGPSIYNLFIAYGIVGIPAYARVMRSEVLSLRDRQYVEAAKLAGLPRRTILFREIVPNGLAPVVVQATLSMGTVIIGAAALSFLGFGVQPPTPDWGRMLADGRTALLVAWWVALFPGIMIFLTVMGFNMLGDGLRDVMDPKTTVEDVGYEDFDVDSILEDDGHGELSPDEGDRQQTATDGGFEQHDAASPTPERGDRS